MATTVAAPRRSRVERNIYRRPDGKLEIGYRDSTGKPRWKVVEGGITAARRTRHDPRGARTGASGCSLTRGCGSVTPPTAGYPSRSRRCGRRRARCTATPW
jgi:hypothetical protein